MNIENTLGCKVAVGQDNIEGKNLISIALSIDGSGGLVSYLDKAQIKVLAEELLKQCEGTVEKGTHICYMGEDIFIGESLKGYRWIATDSDGSIRLYYHEPEQCYPRGFTNSPYWKDDLYALSHTLKVCPSGCCNNWRNSLRSLDETVW